MRMPALAALVYGSIAGAVAMPALAEYPERGERDRVLTCESEEGRMRECAADTRGRVRLLRQISRSACIEGRTWGARRDGVWVSDGCRGEFLIGGSRRHDHARNAPGFVRCESNDGRSQHCPAQTRGGVELVRQLSRSACIRGQNWGWDGSGIWVSGGCRAEFRAGVPTAAGGSDAAVRLGATAD